MLARRGFDSLEASTADEVRRLLRAHRDELVGVVLDLGMPGQTAGDIFGALRRARPGLPVLCTGGYGEEVLAERLAGASRVDFLPKPFGLDALGAAANGLFAAG
jgi:DNA-binding NtrC family response regulator